MNIGLRSRKLLCTSVVLFNLIALVTPIGAHSNANAAVSLAGTSSTETAGAVNGTAPAVTIEPVHAGQTEARVPVGTQQVTLVLTNATWGAAPPVAITGTGVNVTVTGSVHSDDASRLDVSLPPAVVLGGYQVTATAADGSVVTAPLHVAAITSTTGVGTPGSGAPALTIPLTVGVPVPVITLQPNHLAAGSSTSLAIYGVNTTFAGGVTQLWVTHGATVLQANSPVQVIRPTEATATIDPLPSGGTYTVKIVTNAESAAADLHVDHTFALDPTSLAGPVTTHLWITGVALDPNIQARVEAYHSTTNQWDVVVGAVKRLEAYNSSFVDVEIDGANLSLGGTYRLVVAQSGVEMLQVRPAEPGLAPLPSDILADEPMTFDVQGIFTHFQADVTTVRVLDIAGALVASPAAKVLSPTRLRMTFPAVPSSGLYTLESTTGTEVARTRVDVHWHVTMNSIDMPPHTDATFVLTSHGRSFPADMTIALEWFDPATTRWVPNIASFSQTMNADGTLTVALSGTEMITGLYAFVITAGPFSTDAYFHVHGPAALVKVQDEQGQPIPGATICMTFDPTQVNTCGVFGPSDRDGLIRVTFVPGFGSFPIRSVQMGVEYYRPTGATLTISERQPGTAPPTLYLTIPHVSVQGTVSEGGVPRWGGWAYFTADSDATQQYQPAFTASDGTFKLRALAPGQYHIRGYRTDGPTYAWVDLDLAFTVPSAGSVSVSVNLQPVSAQVTVESATLPVAEGWLSIRLASDQNKSYSGHVFQGSAHLRLAPGDYVIAGLNVPDGNQAWTYIPLNKPLHVGNTPQTVAVSIPPVALQGTVLDGTLPAANAWVVLSSGSDPQNRTWFNARTDATGAYSLRLAPSTYRLEGIRLSGDEWIQLGRDIIVTDGPAQVQSLTVPAVAVVGHLFQADGHTPLPTGWLNVRPTTALPGDQGVSARVDTNGQFRLRLAPGTYTVAGVWAELTQKWVDIGGTLQATTDQTTHDITLAASTFVGRLTSGGAPVANAWVAAVPANATNGSRYYHAVTATDGSFELAMPVGAYTIVGYSEPATQAWVPFTLAINATASPVATSVVVPPIAVTGHLALTNHSPIADVYLNLRNGSANFEVQTDSTGAFAFRLAAGIYNIAGYWDPNTQTWHELTGTVTVTAGNVTTADIAIVPANLSGSLVLRTGQTSLPATNAWIVLKNAAGQEVRTLTTSNGSFAFQLHDGTYTLQGAVLSDGWVDLSAATITVTNGVAGGNLANLEVLAVSVSGHLADTASHALGSAWVVVKNTDTGKKYFVKTDSNGNFGLRLPDGHYEVRAIRVANATDWSPLVHGFTVSGGVAGNLNLTK